MKIFGAILLGLFLHLIQTGMYAQNAPIATLGSYNGNEPTITIPITVENFNNIGSCNLRMLYNPSIASAMNITSGPLLGGQFAANLNEPGIIVIGWYTYPGLTLPDNTVIFNIEFSQAGSGITDITWEDDGYSCAWSDDEFNYLNDLPTFSYYIDGSIHFQLEMAPHTIAPNIITCDDSVIDIPIMVTEFNNIGAVSLTLQYDDASLSFQSFTNNSGFPGLIANESNPGTIATAGYSSSLDGFSLADSSILFTLHYNITGNSTEFNWYDDGVSCEYAGPAPSYAVLPDSPQELFYIDGSFTKLQSPEPAGTITGPVDGEVCKGETGVIFSIDPINNATAYEWTLPDGASITGGNNSNTIIASFSQNAFSGNVTVYGYNECGNGEMSPALPITLNSPPVIIEQPISPDTVVAGSGLAEFTVIAEGSNLGYQWQEFITTWENVSDEGIYSGALTETLTITNPPLSMDAYKYRCIVSGSCDPYVISDGLATLTVASITGVNPNDPADDNKNPLNFYAYPNPFKDKINFNYFLPAKGRITIEIRNTYGELIETFTRFNINGSQDQTVRLNAIRPGVYFAKITYETNNRLISITTKIICNNYKN